MSNIEITNCDTGSVEIEGGEFRDELLTLAGADTIAKGTILARRLVALAVVAAADVGNTAGSGAVTAASVVPGPVVPLVGAYVLECTAVVAHGGTFKLVDPNGALVASGLTMTAGSGLATVMEAAGLQWTITDATDFVVGDKFTLTVAADGKLVPYDPAGAGGAQIPSAVLTYEVVSTGPGNVAVRPLIAGRVNATRLIIDADGDGDNITAAILDQLRGRGITALRVTQLSQLDNQ